MNHMVMISRQKNLKLTMKINSDAKKRCSSFLVALLFGSGYLRR